MPGRKGAGSTDDLAMPNVINKPYYAKQRHLGLHRLVGLFDLQTFDVLAEA